VAGDARPPASPPEGLAELRADLRQLGRRDRRRRPGRAAAGDANALPALLNLVQDRPPGVTFDGALNLSILPAGRGGAAT
jgi:hypothetical protein